MEPTPSPVPFGYDPFDLNAIGAAIVEPVVIVALMIVAFVVFGLVVFAIRDVKAARRNT